MSEHAEKKPVSFEMRTPGPVVKEGTVKVDGHDVSRFTRTVQIDSAVGDAHRVLLGLIAYNGLDVVLPAEVIVTFQVLEFGIMDVHELPDGGKRYVFAHKSELAPK